MSEHRLRYRGVEIPQHYEPDADIAGWHGFMDGVDAVRDQEEALAEDYRALAEDQAGEREWWPSGYVRNPQEAACTRRVQPFNPIEHAASANTPAECGPAYPSIGTDRPLEWWASRAPEPVLTTEQHENLQAQQSVNDRVGGVYGWWMH